jgi:outer membrane protein assembly factor BamA
MGTHRKGLLAGLLLGVMLLASVVAQAGSAPLPQAGDQALPPALPPPTPQFQLEAIRVEPPGGNVEWLVLRNLPLRAGQAVDAATLIQARGYLAATGLFTEVELYTERGSRLGNVIAVVAARPSRRFYLDSGVGRDPLRGWYWNVASLRRTGLFGRGGTARVGFRAVPLGQGDTAGDRFRTLWRTSGVYADLEVPGLLAPATDLLVNLSGYRETWTIHQGDSTRFQKIDQARLRVGVRRRLTDELSATLFGGVSKARPRRTLEIDHGPRTPAATVVPATRDKLQFGEAQLSLTRDRQDRLRPWQSGSWAGWVLRGATPREGNRFWGSELEARLALPVAGTRAAAFRLRAAYTSADTPYFLRPIAGGLGSVRGFPEAGLSGPLGARALCSISAEWRHPLIGSNPQAPIVIGTVFADGADYWTASGGRADPAAGAGCGVLVRIPWLQTVNVEVAYPLTDQSRGRPAVFYLSLGRSF